MNLKARVNRLEKTANRATGPRLIVAERQAGETEAQAIERRRMELGNLPGLIVLGETDVNI